MKDTVPLNEFEKKQRGQAGLPPKKWTPEISVEYQDTGVSVMERRSKKKYSTEFKVEAIRLSNESGKPITQVARDLNITPYLLYRWRDQLHKEGAKAFPGNGSKANLDPETTELQRLRRENKRLQEERDILKKTIVFFAAEEAKNSNASENSKDNTQ